MPAIRRLIAGIVVLAGLGYASSAIGEIFDAGAGHILHPSAAPAANGGAGPSNDKVAPDLPADNACDVSRLKESLDKMLAQKKALMSDLRKARKEYKEAKAHHASHGKIVHLKAIRDKLQKRLKSLEARLRSLHARINACLPGAAPPLPPEYDEAQDLEDDDAVVDEPSLDIDGVMKISCKVPRGAKTRSITFRNIGQRLIPSGTPVTWAVKASGQSGQFWLPRSLPVGADLTAADLLKLRVPGNTSCQSQLGTR